MKYFLELPSFIFTVTSAELPDGLASADAASSPHKARTWARQQAISTGEIPPLAVSEDTYDSTGTPAEGPESRPRDRSVSGAEFLCDERMRKEDRIRLRLELIQLERRAERQNGTAK